MTSDNEYITALWRTSMTIWDKPASGQVHQDLISPIHRGPSTSRVLVKYLRMWWSKTARLPLLERHLLTAENQLTGSLWIL